MYTSIHQKNPVVANNSNSSLSPLDQQYLSIMGLSENESTNSSLFDKISAKVQDKSKLPGIITNFYKNKNAVIRLCSEAKDNVKTDRLNPAKENFMKMDVILQNMIF